MDTITAIGRPGDKEAERLAALRSYDVLDTPPEDVYQRLVQLATVIGDKPFGALNLIDETRSWAKAAVGLPHGFEVERHHAFCAEAIRTPDKPLVISDTRAHPRFAKTHLSQLGVRFHLSVPLNTSDGHAIGALCIAGLEPGPGPSEVVLEGLKTLAIAATSQLEMTRQMSRARRLTHELQVLAMRDPLTDVANRRAFDAALVHHVQVSAVARAPLSLVMLDLDHFKRFNDEAGHLAGDEILRECAAAWRASVRETETIARFGGEEFAVILPGCDADRAGVVADRLRAVMPAGLTASAGVTSLRDGETPLELIERADRCLYEAKAAGRDRTIVG